GQRSRNTNLPPATPIDPVVVWMGDYAASGGYFVAAPARAIVAQPLTLTGSIGVAGGKFVLRDLWPKLGVAFDGVRTHESSRYFSANHDYDEHGRERAKLGMDRAYADFTGKVAEGRGLSADEVDALARGRVWTGREAKERGLVDALGGFSVALERLKREAEVQGAVRLRDFPGEKAWWERALRSEAKSSEDEGAVALIWPFRPLAALVQWVSQFMAGLRPRPGIQLKISESIDEFWRR
ncbi:MAG: S49 family peptidase, partial [Myxococcota bacterium]